MATLLDLVAARADVAPERAALVDAASGVPCSGAELHRRVTRRRHALYAAGIRPGDRVALLLPNAPSTIELLLAIASLGAAAVPINLRWRADEVDHLLADAAPALLVADRERLESLGPLPHRPRTLAPDAVGRAPTAHLPAPAGADPALILYTSGTTGRPKGAVLTHRNLLANAHAIVAWLGLGREDRVLTVMPLFHANAIVIGTICPLLAGGATLVADAFHASTFWSLARRLRPTTAGTVPTMLSLLLARADVPPDATASLRFLLTGSAPVPAELVTGFAARFALPVLEGYGLTECTCRATFNPTDGRHRPGSCGLPLAPLRIADERGEPVAPGAIGEIRVQGPHVMREYFRNPEATARALEGGWLRTGDLGHQDADGFVHVVGRATDLIIRGGENVYPREIEEVLYQHPAIVDAAVVGKPHHLYGEVVAAFVVADKARPLEPAAVDRWCRERLADYKCPVEIRIVDELPKGPTGKILKRPLRALVAPS